MHSVCFLLGGLMYSCVEYREQIFSFLSMVGVFLYNFHSFLTDNHVNISMCF